ncbi:hypothetical protein SDJN02_19786, partial [Cucurbita argyrosperma subsp. argyrosperma]
MNCLVGSCKQLAGTDLRFEDSERFHKANDTDSPLCSVLMLHRQDNKITSDITNIRTNRSPLFRSLATQTTDEMKQKGKKADRERENLYLLIQKICLNQNQNEDPRVGLRLEDKGMILS